MTEKSTRMRSPKPASSSRSYVRAKASRPSSQPSGATSARTSSMAARPPRMRGSARMAAANTGGAEARAPGSASGEGPAPAGAVRRSSSTKFDAW